MSIARFVNLKRALALAVVGAAVAAALALVNGDAGRRSDGTMGVAAEAQVVHQDEASEPRHGALAPDFEATTLTGERLRLSDFRGRPVVLNFWGTTCVSCLAEIPHLERVWKEQAWNGLVVLVINVGDDRQRAEAFFRELAATYPSVLDPRQALARAYRAPGLPMTVFINRDGRVERVIVGEINYAIFDRYARLILGERDVPGVDDPLPIRLVSPLPSSQ